MQLQNLREANKLLRTEVKTIKYKTEEKLQKKIINLQKANLALTQALVEAKDQVIEYQIMVHKLRKK